MRRIVGSRDEVVAFGHAWLPIICAVVGILSSHRRGRHMVGVARASCFAARAISRLLSSQRSGLL
jgi:hypothetical protein